MTLGERLRRLRKKRGYTLKDISEAQEISISFMSDVERGVVFPSFKTLCKLAEFHGVTLSKLLKKVEAAQ